MDTKAIIDEFEKWNAKDDFSGVFSIRRDMAIDHFFNNASNDAYAVHAYE
jgi:hypothetical protein